MSFRCFSSCCPDAACPSGLRVRRPHIPLPYPATLWVISISLLLSLSPPETKKAPTFCIAAKYRRLIFGFLHCLFLLLRAFGTLILFVDAVYNIRYSVQYLLLNAPDAFFLLVGQIEARAECILAASIYLDDLFIRKELMVWDKARAESKVLLGCPMGDFCLAESNDLETALQLHTSKEVCFLRYPAELTLRLFFLDTINFCIAMMTTNPAIPIRSVTVPLSISNSAEPNETTRRTICIFP